MALRIQLVVVFLVSLYSVNAFLPAQWLHAMSSDLGFSWKNCGSGSNPIQLKDLKISPDPIKVPGNVTVSLAVTFQSAITDLHASLTLNKKSGPFWIKVPCKHDVGSCTYGNFCQTWAEFCPKYFEKYGFPCTCPLAAGSYSVPDTLMDISKHLPSEADGEFKLQIDIGDASGRVGCIELDFKIKT